MTEIKSAEEVELMRRAGRVVAIVLETLRNEVRPGIKTRMLNYLAEEVLRKNGARASFKGYRGYPASLCVSINEEIVHGIPGDRFLEEGDIVSIDFGAYLSGFHGDAAITVGVGSIAPQAQKLLTTAEAALTLGIKAAVNGARLGDLSAAVQQCAESQGFAVVREYCGHGIGRALHEDPQVPNFGIAGSGLLLKKGMTLAIEPMLTTGDWHTEVDASNGWTVRTADRSLAAHFEHTIVICGNEPEILTKI